MKKILLIATLTLGALALPAWGESEAPPARKATDEQARCILGCATLEQTCRDACKSDSCRDACSKDAQACAADCLTLEGE